MGKRKRHEEEEEEEQVPAAERLPSEILSEILSRVPYRSLCRFKCVSTAWLALCSDPAVRKRSPQTLSGFFCETPRSDGISFLNLSGRGRPVVDPSLPFLGDYEDVRLLNCCGGLLLCHGWNRSTERAEYVVCNPATEEIWTAVPVPRTQEPGAPGYYTFCLCFDPAVPCRFAIFVFIRGCYNIKMVEIYASDTGEWISMPSGWGNRIRVFGGESRYVFLNGTLHFIGYDPDEGTFDSERNIIRSIVTVDSGGNTWRTIPQPPKAEFNSIGHSQGRLHGMEIDHGNGCRISIWVLEDYTSGQWTLKHTANVLELLGRPCLERNECYTLVAIHPEANLIFLDGGVELAPEETFMSYDMDNQKLHVICTLKECYVLQFRPYIPCFLEWPSDAH